MTTDWMDAVTRLRRARRGDVVHRPDCRVLRRASSLPWLWAEGRNDGEILAECPWIKPCKVCHPLGGPTND